MRLQNKLFAGCTSLIALVSMLAGCGGESESSARKDDLKFVAATSTAWDAEVTVGTYKYKFGLELQADNKVSFEALCTGKGSSGGGFPGGGFPGGGFPGGGGEESSSEPDTTDYTQFNFDFTGTWEKEEGYGYVIRLKDSVNSVIHTDYEKTQGRHQFYYLVQAEGGSSTVLFQAKDSGFRKELAKDYKTWDERDSDYIFGGHVTGNNNSVANGYIYCHKDHSAVFNTASGASRAVTMGLAWNIKDGSFVLTEKDKEYTAANSINDAKKGYRIVYSNSTFYCATDAGSSWENMTNEDFDGKTLYQFTGSYTTQGPDGGTKEVELNLTDNNGKMFLYTAGNLSKQGTYTFEGGVFKLKFEGEDEVVVEKNEQGNYVYSFQIKINSFFGTQTIDVVLIFTPGT